MLGCPLRALGLKSHQGRIYFRDFGATTTTTRTLQTNSVIMNHCVYTVSGKMSWSGRGLATCPYMPRLRKVELLTLHTHDRLSRFSYNGLLFLFVFMCAVFIYLFEHFSPIHLVLIDYNTFCLILFYLHSFSFLFIQLNIFALFCFSHSIFT